MFDQPALWPSGTGLGIPATYLAPPQVLNRCEAADQLELCLMHLAKNRQLTFPIAFEPAKVA